MDAALAAGDAILAAAAAQIDSDPFDRTGTAQLLARRARTVVEHAADEAITRTGRALGPGPLCQDGRHAQRVADLTIYIRQSHAERDLAELGRLAGRHVHALRTTPAGNCARFAAKPLTGGGTPVQVWLAALDSVRLPPLDLTECPGLVVVAPHPDDETLGLGATTAQLVASGVDVQVVSVSDGGAAQPGATPSRAGSLEATAKVRTTQGSRHFGGQSGRCRWVCPTVSWPTTRIGSPICSWRSSTAAAPGTWCAATWRGDGHPDHEAVGRAAAAACARTGAALLEYPVWMWHWASPADPAVPWDRAHSVPRAQLGA